MGEERAMITPTITLPGTQWSGELVYVDVSTSLRAGERVAVDGGYGLSAADQELKLGDQALVLTAGVIPRDKLAGSSEGLVEGLIVI